MPHLIVFPAFSWKLASVHYSNIWFWFQSSGKWMLFFVSFMRNSHKTKVFPGGICGLISARDALYTTPISFHHTCCLIKKEMRKKIYLRNSRKSLNMIIHIWQIWEYGTEKWKRKYIAEYQSGEIVWKTRKHKNTHFFWFFSLFKSETFTFGFFSWTGHRLVYILCSSLDLCGHRPERVGTTIVENIGLTSKFCWRSMRHVGQISCWR